MLLTPWRTVTLPGLALREKSGAALTVRFTVAVCESGPEVPVMVTVLVPVVAVALALKVSVLEPVAGFGLNAAVTPLGSALVVKLTLPANPFSGLIVMVLAPLAPRTTVMLLGLALSEKSPVEALVTVRPVDPTIPRRVARIVVLPADLAVASP